MSSAVPILACIACLLVTIATLVPVIRGDLNLVAFLKMVLKLMKADNPRRAIALCDHSKSSPVAGFVAESITSSTKHDASSVKDYLDHMLSYYEEVVVPRVRRWRSRSMALLIVGLLAFLGATIVILAWLGSPQGVLVSFTATLLFIVAVISLRLNLGGFTQLGKRTYQYEHLLRLVLPDLVRAMWDVRLPQQTIRPMEASTVSEARDAIRRWDATSTAGNDSSASEDDES